MTTRSPDWMIVLPWGIIFLSPRLMRAIKRFLGSFNSAMVQSHQLWAESMRISFNLLSFSLLMQARLR